MIVLEGVDLDRDGRAVLRGVSVSLGRHEKVGVIGHNGSGKSAFARLLNGIELPGAGRVSVDGLDTVAERDAVRRRVGFVFQNPDSQIVYPVVREDLGFGLHNLGLSRAEAGRRVEAVARDYGIGHLLDRMSYRLSGGEKQLVALAGVLAMEPDWLVLDEPTTLLDLRNKKRITELILGLDQAVVMVSHDLEFLEDFDRVLRFDNGRLVADGPPRTVIPAYVEQALC